MDTLSTQTGGAATQALQTRLISIVSCDLPEDEIALLRDCLPLSRDVIFQNYSRSGADCSAPDQIQGPLIIFGNASDARQLRRYTERPLTRLILLTDSDTQETDLGDLTLSRPLEADTLRNVIGSCMQEIFSELAGDISSRLSRMDPVSAEGVVVVDRYNHILFMDHSARQLGVPRLLRIIESVSAEDFPLAGNVHGLLALPGRSNTALRLDARSVEHQGGLVMVIRLQTEEIADTRDFGSSAAHEDVTGLISREGLTALLNNVIDVPEHAHDVLILIDLDRMKIITEGVGHEASDHAIAVTGARLHALCRREDRLARIGNDEFALLIPDAISDENLSKICAKWLKQITEPVSLPGGRPLHLTASIGSARLGDAGGDVNRLLRQADIALAHARQDGGNCYRAYDGGMSDKLRRRWDMETKLREAIDREQFHLEFQPLFQSGSNVIAAAEALLRWEDPTHGRVYPDQFIPLLEETGLIVPVGEWIIREACTRAREWQGAGLPQFRVSVNVSPIQVEEPGLVQAVQSALEVTGLDPQYLVLEITERLLLEYTDRAHEVLHSLAELGVKLFLDDFGTGYSSLGYLKRFPVCGIKIDRSFIDSLPDGADDRAITLAILDMCRHLELWAIPEGVENAAQAAFLTEHGATMQQGFFYSKPLPASQFSTLLDSSLKQPH